MQIKHLLSVPWTAAPYRKLWQCNRNLLEYSRMIGHIKVHLKNILEMCCAYHQH